MSNDFFTQVFLVFFCITLSTVDEDFVEDVVEDVEYDEDAEDDEDDALCILTLALFSVAGPFFYATTSFSRLDYLVSAVILDCYD